MTTPTLVKVDTTPGVDPYHANTGGQTYTQLFLDLRDGRYGLVQECNDNATPSDEWHGIVRTATLHTRPDEDYARAYLTGDALPLIERVLAGGSVEWDGSNHVGSLDDDAQDAWDEIVYDLRDLPETDWSLWDIAEWLNGDNCGITAETTNAEIERIAKTIYGNADVDHVIINGGLDAIRDHLYEIRYDELEDYHLTTAEAAKLIGVTAAHVRRMCISGEIEAKKRGHDWSIYARFIDGITPKRRR